MKSVRIPCSLSYISALSLFTGVLSINLWLAKPFYNWDLLGYVGAATAYTQNTPQAIYAQTFSMVKGHVPEDSYRALTTGSAYKIAITEHPEYFIQQIPFYSAKPLYPGLMFLMNELGVNSVAASVLISKVAYVGIGLLLYVWAAAWLRPLVAFMVTSLMISVSYVFDLARYSTPDGLSALVILAAFFLLIERRAERSALALLVIAIAIRPDDLLLLLIAALYIAIVRRDRLRWAVGSILVGIVVYLDEVRWAGYYGWTTFFYHSFVQPIPAPSDFTSPLSLSGYLKIYLLHANPKVLQSLVLFTLLNVLTINLYYRRVGKGSAWFHLLIVNSLFMLVHWLVFPDEMDRQFVASYLLIIMALTNGINFLAAVGAGEEVGGLRPEKAILRDTAVHLQ